MNLATVTLASTVPLLVAPLLSWISSRATTSGERRLVTTAWASSANLLSGLPGARFSTLYVAMVASRSAAGAVTSRSRWLSWTAPTEVAASV